MNEDLNRTYNFFKRRYIRYVQKITTIITRFKVKIQGVTLGKNCLFYGNMTFNVDNGGGQLKSEKIVYSDQMQLLIELV